MSNRTQSTSNRAARRKAAAKAKAMGIAAHNRAWSGVRVGLQVDKTTWSNGKVVYHLNGGVRR